MKRISRVALIALVGISVASCGDSLDEGKAAGVYRGSTSRNVDYYSLVTKSDELWTMYGNESARGFNVQGFLQGIGEAAAGQFRSTDTRDFGQTPPVAFGLAASYQAGSTLSGSYKIADTTITFTGAVPPPTLFDFSTPAQTEFIAGSWSLRSPGGSSTVMRIAANGAISGSEGLCEYNGVIGPRTDGTNVYSHQITFGSQCLRPNQTFTGIAVSFPTAEGVRQLLIAGVDAGRTAGAIYVGTRVP
jgi:hypothetical protein